jgi:hypothetical protein
MCHQLVLKFWILTELVYTPDPRNLWEKAFTLRRNININIKSDSHEYLYDFSQIDMAF